MILGVGFEEAYSVVISSLGNVGPGIGKCGPSYSWSGLPDMAKWISALLMLIGRLELFTVVYSRILEETLRSTEIPLHSREKKKNNL